MELKVLGWAIEGRSVVHTGKPKACFHWPCSWMMTGVIIFFKTWTQFYLTFFSSKRPRGVMAKYYLLDSYSVGVESGWGSQMVGVFDSPDGCSVWCSVTLGSLIDMLPPSPPSLRLLFLHLLLQHSHCYEDGYQPPGLCRSWEDGMGLST